MLFRRLGTLLPSLVIAPVLLATWQGDGVTPLLKGLAAAVLATTAASPFAGLLLIALLLPVATPIQVFSGAPMTGAQVSEMLLAPFLVAAGLRLTAGPTIPPSRLGWPATLFGTVVVAACVVQLGVDQQATATAADFFALLGMHVTRTYFSDFSAFAPLHLAMQWFEALLLGVLAERLLWQHPERRALAVRVLLIGAAIAASFAVVRLVQATARSAEPWIALPTFLRTLRISPHYPDLNAAGSYFVLFAVPAIWLTFKERRRWFWPVTILIWLGLWLTHSRAAHVGALLALLAGWTVDRRPSLRTLLIGAALGILLIGFAIRPRGMDQPDANAALGVRAELTQIGLRVAGIHPIFGVGPGQFQEASKAFVPPGFAMRAAGILGENAHNQFIQTLAELGTVGLLPFLWLVFLPVRHGLKSIVRRTASPPLVALTWGVVAFLVSCLLGHPLLIAQVLTLFLLALGVTAGVLPEPPAPAQPLVRWFVVAAIGVLCISVPFRMDARRRAAELDNVIVGSTSVRGTQDEVRFRLVEPRSVWFVATAVKSVTLPLRRAVESTQPCRVAVTLDGQPATEVAPTSDGWLRLDLPLPPPARARASRAIGLNVMDDGCKLLVGQIQKKH